MFAGLASLRLAEHEQSRNYYRKAVALQPEGPLAWKVRLFPFPSSFLLALSPLLHYLLLLYSHCDLFHMIRDLQTTMTNTSL